ncbi:MAG: hypothetical protein OXH56_00265 [Gemmatimonadetes bacterium]|nr:hypothetical protein [Gemmatimonadota bacterium]
MIDIVVRNHYNTDEDIQRLADGRYSAVIAVNDDVGDGYPIQIRTMDIDTYMKYGSVLYAHESWEDPIGRTTKLYFDDRNRLIAEFEFSKNNDRAAEKKNLWDQGHLRSASISARPMDDGRHRLVEWSIVSVPADTDAVRARLAAANKGESTMTTEERQALIKDLKAEFKGSENESALASRLESLVKDLEAKDADRALEERLGKIIDDKLESAGLTRAAGAQGTGEGADQGAGEGTGTGEGLTEEDVEKRAAARVALLRQVDGLLPDGFDTAGKTDKEILVAAGGDEVENAADRSEDYLLGRIEEIAQRRADASRGTSGIGTGGGTEIWQSGSRAMTAVELRRMESQKKAS